MAKVFDLKNTTQLTDFPFYAYRSAVLALDISLKETLVLVNVER